MKDDGCMLVHCLCVQCGSDPKRLELIKGSHCPRGRLPTWVPKVSLVHGKPGCLLRVFSL